MYFYINLKFNKDYLTFWILNTITFISNSITIINSKQNLINTFINIHNNNTIDYFINDLYIEIYLKKKNFKLLKFPLFSYLKSRNLKVKKVRFEGFNLTLEILDNNVIRLRKNQTHFIYIKFPFTINLIFNKSSNTLILTHYKLEILNYISTFFKNMKFNAFKIL